MTKTVTNFFRNGFSHRLFHTVNDCRELFGGLGKGRDLRVFQKGMNVISGNTDRIDGRDSMRGYICRIRAAMRFSGDGNGKPVFLVNLANGIKEEYVSFV